MADSIVARCREVGIDHARLKACMDSKDNWGSMIHAFEYLTVLGIVVDAMRDES